MLERYREIDEHLIAHPPQKVGEPDDGQEKIE
jgi:hypothetical protein